MQRLVVVTGERSGLAGIAKLASAHQPLGTTQSRADGCSVSNAVKPAVTSWPRSRMVRSVRRDRPSPLRLTICTARLWRGRLPSGRAPRALRRNAHARHCAWMPRVQAAHYQLFAPSIRYAGASTWDEPRLIHWDAARITGHPYLDLLMQRRLPPASQPPLAMLG